jgi:hypothetical protein
VEVDGYEIKPAADLSGAYLKLITDLEFHDGAPYS